MEFLCVTGISASLVLLLSQRCRDCLSYLTLWFLYYSMLPVSNFFVTSKYFKYCHLKMRGTWGFAMLWCWCFFDAVNKISICGVAMFVFFTLRCSVKWNYLRCFSFLCDWVMRCSLIFLAALRCSGSPPCSPHRCLGSFIVNHALTLYWYGLCLNSSHDTWCGVHLLVLYSAQRGLLRFPASTTQTTISFNRQQYNHLSLWSCQRHRNPVPLQTQSGLDNKTVDDITQTISPTLTKMEATGNRNLKKL